MDAQLRLIPRPTTPADPDRDGGAASEAHSPTRRAAVAGSVREAAEAPLQWRIDDTARERGRAGISRAREALRNARRPRPADHHTTAA